MPSSPVHSGIVLDVETTGLNPASCSLLSIGAVDLENNETFYIECKPWAAAHVAQRALEINGFLDANAQCVTTEGQAIAQFLTWLTSRSNITPIGQNVAFDMGFIEEACKRRNLKYPLGHRGVDLHSLTYAWLARQGITKLNPKKRKTDIALDDELVLVGIECRKGIHNALEDALLEAELYRRLQEI